MKQFKIAQLKEKLRRLEKPNFDGRDGIDGVDDGIGTGFSQIDDQLASYSKAAGLDASTQADIAARVSVHTDTDLHGSAAPSLAAPILSRGAVHHVVPQSLCDMPAALGFAVHLALRFARQQSVLWTQTLRARTEWGEPYLPGLVQQGVSVEQFLYMAALSPRDWLWVLEEASICADIGCLIGLCAQKELSFTASRRFSLAVQRAATTMILLSPHPHHALAVSTQWHVSTMAGGQWQITLKRRAGAALPPPRAWIITPDPSASIDVPYRDRAPPVSADHAHWPLPQNHAAKGSS